MKRSVPLLLLAVCLIAGGWWGVRAFLGSKFKLTLLEGELSKSLGVAVKVQDVSIDGVGRLALSGVSVADPEGQPTATVQLATASLPWSSLLHGQVQLTGLHLQGLLLTLDPGRLAAFQRHPFGSGARDYPITFSESRLELYADRSRSQKLASLEGLQGEAASDGRLTLHDAQKRSLTAKGGQDGWQLEVQEFPLTILSLWLPDAKARLEQAVFTGQAALKAGHATADGTLTSPAYTGSLQLQRDGEEYHLHAAGTSAQLGKIDELDVRLKHVQVDLDWQWQVSEAHLTLPAGRVDARGTWPALVLETKGFQLPHQADLGEPKGGLPPFAVQTGLLTGGLVLRGEGQPEEMELEARVTELRVGSKVWKNLPVRAFGKGNWKKIEIEQFSLGGLVGEATVEPGGATHVSLPDMDLRDLNAALPPTLRPLKGKVSLEADYTPAKGWNARFTSPQILLGRLTFDKLRIALDGAAPDVKGEFLALGQKIVVQGAWPKLELKGKDLDVSRWPGRPTHLKGKLDVSVTPAKKEGWDFVLDGKRLVLDKQPMPSLKGRLVWKDGALASQDLKLEAQGWKEPLAITLAPLSDAARKQSAEGMRVEAKFTGQEIQPLVGDMHGQLTGQLKATWQPKQAELHYQGEVANFKREGLERKHLTVSLDWKKYGAAAALWTARASDDKFNLADLKGVPKEVSGQGEVSVSISALDTRPLLDLKLRELKLNGVSLGQATARARALGNLVLLESSSIQFGGGKLEFRGQFNQRNQQVELSANLDKRKLADLPGVPKELGGTLTGKALVQGPVQRPEVKIEGKAAGLTWKGDKVGSGALTLTGAPGALKGTLKGLPAAGVAALASRKVTGELDLGFEQLKSADKLIVTGSLRDGRMGGKPLPALTVTGQLKSGHLDPLTVTLAGTPPWTLQGKWNGELSLDGELTGQDLSPLGMLAGVADMSGKLMGKVSFQTSKNNWKARFSGKALEVAGKGQSLGSGPLEVNATQAGIILKAGPMAAAGISALQDRELTGEVRCDLNSDGKAWSGQLRLDQARQRGAPFPNLELKLKGTAASSVARLDNLLLFGEPPLTGSGSLDLATRALTLQGKLTGQSLADLARYGGATSAPEVKANLTGPYTLKGDTLTFQGTASNLEYRGVALGSGQLRIVADSALDGELTLEHPVDVASSGAVPRGIMDILPVKGVLANVKISGVKLGGTLKKPEVKPLWVTPTVRVTLPDLGGGKGK